MKTLSLCMLLCLPGLLFAQQKLVPASSPTQQIVQEFGLGKIEISYSRPSLKGRTVFLENSDIVPLGKPWRAGANQPTKIYLSEPCTFGGVPVDSGRYALYAIPGKENWTIILNNKGQNFMSEHYIPADDVAKVSIVPQSINNRVETFTISISNVEAQQCDVDLVWANTLIRIPIVIDIKKKMQTLIEKALQVPDKPPYAEAATYYSTYANDLPQALVYINKAIEKTPKAYWFLYQKANIQKKNGKHG